MDKESQGQHSCKLRKKDPEFWRKKNINQNFQSGECYNEYPRCLVYWFLNQVIFVVAAVMYSGRIYLSLANHNRRNSKQIRCKRKTNDYRNSCMKLEMRHCVLPGHCIHNWHWINFSHAYMLAHMHIQPYQQNKTNA